MAENENDLPLLANTSEVLVRHFLLDLTCDLENRHFEGSITLFLDPITAVGQSKRVFSIQEYQNTNHSALCAQETNTNTPGLLNERTIDESGNVHSSGSSKHPLDSRVKDDKSQNKNIYELVLDCRDIDIHRVEAIDCSHDLELSIPEGLSRTTAETFSASRSVSGRDLNFSVEKWCLKITKDNVYFPWDFPRIIRIHYRTRPEGASLRWATDQDNNACMYTAGMWINNRSLMPCQEYGSLSTWQAFMRVQAGLCVVMGGDQPGSDTLSDNGMVESYHYSTVPLPSFTLAFGIGRWGCRTIHSVCETESRTRNPSDTCLHNPPCQVTFATTETLPCRVFGPESLLNQVSDELLTYIPKATKVVQDMLGPSPFPRIDIIIYPPCSQDMAMSNPNLILLSQSMFPGDKTMLIKLGHEISHYWWGLLLGARDWTEEWLSEGFATYSEDSIHKAVMGWSDAEYRDYSELRALLRYRILKAEMSHTEAGLQRLRPNEGKDQDEECQTGRAMVIKDGMNPNKLFTQVHYLKGYFLLRHLSALVGVSSFDAMLKQYVTRYHGDMVTSHQFLTLVFEKFPTLRDMGLSVDVIYTEWLDNPGLPKALNDFAVSSTNVLHSQAISETEKWRGILKAEKLKRNKRKRFKLEPDPGDFHKLQPEQLVYLLEEILSEAGAVPSSVIRRIHDTYSLSAGNPDVRHRWCEVVIKHKCAQFFSHVQAFLLNHQAMGIYLYGEMMISRCKKLMDLAKKCFLATGPEMEHGTRNMVRTMLYGE